MRVLATGCWHIGKTLAGYDFKRERAAALDDVCARAADAELVVHLGDLFDCGRPSPREYAEAIDMLEAINRPMFVLLGNHDANPGLEPDALEPLTRYRFRSEVKFVREPGTHGVGGKAFAFLPHWTDARAREFWKGDPHDKGHTAQQDADAFLEELVKERVVFEDGNEAKVSALFTHVDMAGFAYPVGEDSQRVNVALDTDVLEKLPFPVVCGHLHKPGKREPNLWFPGSLLPFDFSTDRPQNFVLEMDL